MKFFYVCVLLALVATLCLSPVTGQPSVLTRFKRQSAFNNGKCAENETCLGIRGCVPCKKYMNVTGEDSCPKEDCKHKKEA